MVGGRSAARGGAPALGEVVTHRAEEVDEDVELHLRIRAAELEVIVKGVRKRHRLREHGRSGGKDGEQAGRHHGELYAGCLAIIVCT